MSELDAHARLVQEAGPVPASPLGDKPADLRARRLEAARLSALMAASDGFSFLRLGDMELTCLLAAQEGSAAKWDPADSQASGTMACGHPGIGPALAPALRRAFEQASYVDFHERLWPVSKLLPRLKLNAVAGQQRNPDAETSYLLLTWLEFEFQKFCQGRKIGLAGAEAVLLKNLLRHEEFRQAAANFWPAAAEIHFHQIREDGRNVSANLDLIREDLRGFIKATGVDTVFLSLGGAGKILCVELASELGVRMFDAGSMLRALTYSGSDGNRATRATHSPFLYRVPFAVWCGAMEQSWPRLAPHEKLAKIHAQIILEVQKKEVGWTHASHELDLCPDNLEAFGQAHRFYLERYGNIFELSAETRRERAGFLHFCGQHGLTAEGKKFYRWFRLKSLAARIFRRGKN